MICPITRETGFQAVTKAKRAVVVGGGFIGLEMAENLVHLGLEVTLVEMLDQVMPPLDPEMARLVEGHLESVASASRSMTRWPASNKRPTARSKFSRNQERRIRGTL